MIFLFDFPKTNRTNLFLAWPGLRCSAMSEAQLPPPEFSTEGMFVATLKRPPHRRDLGERLGEKLTKNQIPTIHQPLQPHVWGNHRAL